MSESPPEPTKRHAGYAVLEEDGTIVRLERNRWIANEVAERLPGRRVVPLWILDDGDDLKNQWVKPGERLPEVGDLIAVKWSDEDGDHGYGVFIYDELNATSLCLCDLWMKLPETECIAPNAEDQ